MRVLDGRVAVITGGTRGLGLAIARACVEAGAAVVLASRTQSSVRQAVEQMQAAGGRAAGMALDVADLAQMEALRALALSSFGRLDIWVNNAGIAGPYGPTMGFDPVVFTQVVNTNILGVYYGSRTAMQHFLAQRSGKLINLLGHGYKGPLPWQNAYGSSKTWVRSFTLALAAENKDSGVGVFAFNPGMVLTELLTDVEVIAGAEDKLRVFPTIVRMWAKPASYPAQKAVWIASSATDGKTGKLYSLQSTAKMAGGALREGLRALTRRPSADPGVRIQSVPPYNGKPGAG